MTAVPCHRIRSQAAPVMNMLLPLTSRWTIRSLCTCFKAMQSCVTQFFTLPMGSSKSFLAPPAPPGPRVYRWTQPTSANLDLANLANLKIYPPFLSHHWWDMYRFYKYVYIDTLYGLGELKPGHSKPRVKTTPYNSMTTKLWGEAAIYIHIPGLLQRCRQTQTNQMCFLARFPDLSQPASSLLKSLNDYCDHASPGRCRSRFVHLHRDRTSGQSSSWAYPTQSTHE